MASGKNWFWSQYEMKNGSKLTPLAKKVFSKFADDWAKSEGVSWLDAAAKVAANNDCKKVRSASKKKSAKKKTTTRKKTRRKKSAKKKTRR